MSPPLSLEPSAFQGPGDSLPRPHGNCYWLLPGRLLAGEYPVADGDAAAQQRRLGAIVESGVRCLVNLTDPVEELPDYTAPMQRAAGPIGVSVRMLNFPITDYDVPTVPEMRHILHAIQAAWQADEPVYLHCHGGIGRTGTVVGCLLVEHGFSPAQALALIADKWRVMEKRRWAPMSPETDAQRAFIAGWVPTSHGLPAAG